MIIKVLAENTSISKDIGFEHGLSLYIETERHKILFDVGASGLFLKNAEKMGADIADVDYLVISHGHYDHGGGLCAFLKENKKAEVFIHRLALGKHYAERAEGKIEYIGLGEDLKRNPQIVFTADRFFIDRGMELFSNTAEPGPPPRANRGLMMEQGGKLTADGFLHEQNLIIRENDKSLLITGCAHKGIINILKQVKDLKGYFPDYIIGGFHLWSRNPEDCESEKGIDEVARALAAAGAKCYTGHCTGLLPYKRLKAQMGERIGYLAAGEEIEI